MSTNRDKVYQLTEKERGQINRFRVTQQRDIFSILNGLKTSLEVGKVYYTSKHYSLTSIVQMDLKANTMVLDNTQAFLLNKPVHREPYLIYRTQQNGLNIQFITQILGQRRHAEGPGLLVKIPDEILRIQRRQFPRFSAIGKGIQCHLINNNNQARRVVVADLSQQGVGLVSPLSNSEAEQHDEQIRGCLISLPHIGQLEMPLTMQNCSEQSLKDGQRVKRYGFEFSHLSDIQQPQIRQYLSQNFTSFSAH